MSLRNYNVSTSYIAPFTTTGTWQFLTFTIPPPPSGTAFGTGGSGALELFISALGTTQGTLGWSETTNAGYTGSLNWAATLNTYIQFTGVQLEKGSVATPFEVRPYATELALCQRYYHRTCNTGAVPIICPLTIISSTIAEGVYKLPVTMRIVPALATSGTATLDWHVVGNNSVGGLSILTASGQSTIDNVVIIASTVGNGTAGSVTVGQTRMLMIASGFIDFSAEL
jgi:hypothetical protein